MEGDMPEYKVSTEARWLASNWPNLEQYVGRWIAVVGERVEFAATGIPGGRGVGRGQVGRRAPSTGSLG
jgi:hypothetical protein